MLAQSTLDTRLRPLEAVKAACRLFANPDETKEVFVILRAMRGRSGIRAFQRFRTGAMGARILAERRILLTTLQDHRVLAVMAPDTLGGAYQRFMAQEQLSTAGLVAPSQNFRDEPVSAEVALFRERMRDMHDLTHVLTGYGRDPLGELCLLAFTYPHNRNLGMALIALMGFLRIKSWPVRRAVLEAWRHGRKACCWFPDMDWEALLPEQLDRLRRRFNIIEPAAYRAAMS
jgi:ubiquinone biosynthesis protein COQ4